MKLWLAAAGAILAQAGPVATGDPRLPTFLHVIERGQVARDGFPASGSVPFPKGALRDEALPRLGLKDAQGRPVPVQLRVVGRWPDRSVKWLLFDFPSTQPAGARASYRPELAAPAPAGAPLARFTDEGVEVDTGPLRAVLGEDKCAFYLREGAGWKPVADGFESQISLRDRRTGAVERYALPVASAAVEENGPLKAVVKVVGIHTRSDGGAIVSPSTIRLVFYRNQGFVRIYHTFVMSRDPDAFTLPRIALDLRLVSDAATASFVEEGGAVRKLAARGERLAVVQEDLAKPTYPPVDRFQPRFRILSGGKAVAEGRRYRGAMALDGAGFRVGVYLRHMWQMHPKALSYLPPYRTLSAEFWPPEAGDLDLMRTEKKNPKHFQEFMARDPLARHEHFNPMVYTPFNLTQSAMGISRTHELVLDFSGTDPSRLAGLFTAPFVAAAPPDWNVATGAMGRQGVPGAHRPDAEALAGKMVDLLLREVEKSGWYGAFIWGNVRYTYHPESRSWQAYHPKFAWWNTGHVMFGGNLLEALWQHYFRTGDPAVYEFAEAHGRQVMDMCVVHYHEERAAGFMVRHGGYDPWGGEHKPSGAHCTIRGLPLHYFATGYERTLEACRLVAERQFRKAVFHVDDRNGAGVLDTIAQYYLLSLDPRHYDECMGFVDRLHRHVLGGGCGAFHYWQGTIRMVYRLCEERGDVAAMAKLRELHLKAAAEELRGGVNFMNADAAVLAYELSSTPEDGARVGKVLDLFAEAARGPVGWDSPFLGESMNFYGNLPTLFYALHWGRRKP